MRVLQQTERRVELDKFELAVIAANSGLLLPG